MREVGGFSKRLCNEKVVHAIISPFFRLSHRDFLQKGSADGLLLRCLHWQRNVTFYCFVVYHVKASKSIPCYNHNENIVEFLFFKSGIFLPDSSHDKKAIQ